MWKGTLDQKMINKHQTLFVRFFEFQHFSSLHRRRVFFVCTFLSVRRFHLSLSLAFSFESNCFVFGTLSFKCLSIASNAILSAISVEWLRHTTKSEMTNWNINNQATSTYNRTTLMSGLWYFFSDLSFFYLCVCVSMFLFDVFFFFFLSVFCFFFSLRLLRCDRVQVLMTIV